MNDGPVLIIGATGLLGPYLLRAFSDQGEALGAARTNAQVRFDALDADQAGRVIEELRPRAVVYAAGFTDVDGCEADPARAYAVNRDGVRIVAGALNPGAGLVYISTDQVYPDEPGPHGEDQTGPVNVYGKSKLAGEEAALAHPRGLALRVNFFGPSLTPGRTSLSDFVIGSLGRNKRITIFEDIFFSPLHMRTLAGYVARRLNMGLTGVYNLGSRDGMSKKDFALEVAAHKGLQTETATPGSGAARPGGAPRPRDMRMDVDRIEAALGEKMPTLKQEIAKL